MIYLIIYLIIGLILAGLPTLIDYKMGAEYSLSDWVFPIFAGLLWPIFLFYCWYLLVIEDI